jgi:arsenite-transporting ATPase
VNLFGSEIVGYESLKALSARIYGPVDPLDRFVAEEPYRLIKQDGRYCLRLKLPFVVKEHIDLSMISDKLILRIGSYKRHTLLPKQVAGFAHIGESENRGTVLEHHLQWRRA